MKKRTGFLYKIVGVVVLALAVLTLFLSIFTIMRVHNSLQASLYSQLNKAYDGTAYLFDIYKRNALGFAKDIAVNPDLVAAAKAKDRDALFALTTPLVEDAGLEYMVITDDKGFVIIRTHQPGVIPAPDDSIANQMNIQHALKGEPYVTVEQGKVVFLSVRAGAPIRDKDGTIIGAISTGYVLSENTIAYDIRNTFDVDCVLYLKDAVVASTYDLEEDATLYDFTGNADSILERVSNGETVNEVTFIGQTSYLTAIGPLVGAGDEVVGMIETSMPESVLDTEINRMVRNIVIGAALIMLLMLTATLLFFRRYLRPMGEIATRLFEVADGDLSGEALTGGGSDELGALVQAGNEMQSRLKTLVSDVVIAADRVASSSEELDAGAGQLEQRAWDITGQIREVSDEVEKLATREDSFYGVRESLRKTKEEFLVMSETMTEISRAAAELSELSEELSEATKSFKL